VFTNRYNWRESITNTEIIQPKRIEFVALFVLLRFNSVVTKL